MINGFGSRLKNARKKKGLTKVQVAELLDIQTATVSMFENDTRRPKVENIVKLAKIYGVSTDYLFGLATTTENNIELNGLKEYEKSALKGVYEAFVKND